jgi:hypothetical protein
LAIACNGDDDEGSVQFLAKPGSDLIAVKVRETEVEQHKVRLLTSCKVKSIIPIVGDSDIMADDLEPLCSGLSGIVAIIDDKDSGHIDLPV